MIEGAFFSAASQARRVLPIHEPSDTASHWAQLLEARPRATLCWLATTDEEHGATVSPKELFCFPSPGRMLIADIASARSLRNIARDPRACASLVDIHRIRGGFKLYGQCNVIAAGDADFPQLVAPLEALAGELGLIAHVIELRVTSVVAIAAPAHLLRP